MFQFCLFYPAKGLCESRTQCALLIVIHFYFLVRKQKISFHFSVGTQQKICRLRLLWKWMDGWVGGCMDGEQCFFPHDILFFLPVTPL